MRVVRTLSEAIADPATRTRDWHGACACGSVRFLVTTVTTTTTPCICPRCRGTDLRFVTADRESFRLLTGGDCLTDTLNEARSPHHFFCRRCGEPAFGHPDPTRVTVNAALLARGDPDAILQEQQP